MIKWFAGYFVRDFLLNNAPCLGKPVEVNND